MFVQSSSTKYLNTLYANFPYCAVIISSVTGLEIMQQMKLCWLLKAALELLLFVELLDYASTFLTYILNSRYNCCLTQYGAEQIHLSLTGDPTQMMVSWTTSGTS